MRSNGRPHLVFAVAGLIALLFPVEALAKKGIFHKVRTSGESYADIADHYYGKRYLERHLRMFNRRPEPLRVGTTIIIPTYQVVAVRRGQTLDAFAAAHLSDAGRSGYLAELHGLRGRERKLPRTGKRLRVVQSLKHTMRRGESLKSIATLYYRDTSARRLKLLKAYNKIDGARVRPGRAIRIPLDTSAFSNDAVSRRAKRQFTLRKVAVAEPPPPAPPPPKRRTSRKQARSDTKAQARRLAGRLETAERLYGNGDYSKCASVSSRALSGAPDGAPLVRTKVELLRLLAFSQIARGQYPESKATFKELLVLDPKYQLDLYRTSPKILDIFEAVAMH